MSLLLVFSFVFLLFSYVPFAVSCVTVPGDLDLIFSRLSCAVRFDLTRGYWQQNRRRASALRNPTRAALTKLPDAGRKEGGREKEKKKGKKKKKKKRIKKERLVT